MPLDAGVAGGIISAGGQMLNAVTTADQNRRSRRWSEKMYEKQKSDNWFAWHAQNEYNSPQQQMKRLQEAGLNPHLVYGGSSGGTAGTASSLPTPDVQSPQWRSPDFGSAAASALTYLNQVADYDIKQAQHDNLKAQNTVLQNEAMLRGTQAERAQYDLDFERSLTDVSADTRRERLRQTRTQIDYMTNEDARRAASNSASVQEAMERMTTMALQRANMQLEGERLAAEINRIRQITSNDSVQNQLMQLDLKLRKDGINPTDPMWARFVGQKLNDIYDTSGSLLDDAWKTVKSWWNKR